MPALIALCFTALGKPTLGSLVALGEISISGTLITEDELANSLQVLGFPPDKLFSRENIGSHSGCIQTDYCAYKGVEEGYSVSSQHIIRKTEYFLIGLS
ncbi:MAG: hypothetical protein K0S76_488 [Herbinix sp.]|nr:hypothetical protein [Herbinix sp.]